jgi:hypothetical protein
LNSFLKLSISDAPSDASARCGGGREVLVFNDKLPTAFFGRAIPLIAPDILPHCVHTRKQVAKIRERFLNVVILFQAAGLTDSSRRPYRAVFVCALSTL